ncbi:MAG: sporulation protein YabP [Ruminococcaceae bacterium]|nr:sporulation protein YabP [Oscillospiraceae bacterium]
MQNEQLFPHSVSMKDRASVDITGVTDVEKFDESIIVARTDLGKLTVKGSGLKVISLDIDTADKSLRIEGRINSLEYSNSGRSKNESIVSKLFG